MSDRFVARVIDTNDPEKAGRIKIRIYGIHDDETKVPDDLLPWARCVYPVTNPVHQGVSGATTGMVPDATVVGYFADSDKQIPLIDGTIGMSDGTVSDFPKHDRGEDFNPIANNSIWHVGTSELKFLNSKTIAPIEYVGQDIDQMLEQIGEGNIAGVMSIARDALDTFNKLKYMVENSPFEQLNSVIQGFSSDLGSIATGGIEDSLESSLGGNILSTSDHLVGSVGSVTSKLGINNTQDALNRISGSRFIMSKVMSSISTTLDNVRVKFGK